MPRCEFMKKVKRILGVNDTLCDNCEHWLYCSDRNNACEMCKQYGGEFYCKCSDSGTNVKECKYFKPIVPLENFNGKE
jgi:hypothetical protein